MRENQIFLTLLMYSLILQKLSKRYSTDYFHEKNNANPITIAITFDQKINGESSTIVKIIRNEDGVNNAKYHYKTSNEI